MSDGVPGPVLEAFGVSGPPVPLAGGQGESLRAGHLVFKPVRDADEAISVGELLERVQERGFRLGRPVRALDGRWVVDGWSAARFVAGTWAPAGRWPEIFAAGRAFTAGLDGCRRPEFLGRRTHRWAVADAVAWGEADHAPLDAAAPLLARLVALRRQVDAPPQLVHGDLAGNLLLADGVAPAVIDVSPYWRPAAFADAVLAVDGLIWDGAGPEVLTLASAGPPFGQAAVRALIFRLVAQDLAARAEGPWPLHDLAGFGAVADLVEELLATE